MAFSVNSFLIGMLLKQWSVCLLLCNVFAVSRLRTASSLCWYPGGLLTSCYVDDRPHRVISAIVYKKERKISKGPSIPFVVPLLFLYVNQGLFSDLFDMLYCFMLTWVHKAADDDNTARLQKQHLFIFEQNFFSTLLHTLVNVIIVIYNLNFVQ